MTEVRIVETNEAFRYLQGCLDWLNNKQVDGVLVVLLFQSCNEF